MWTTRNAFGLAFVLLLSAVACAPVAVNGVAPADSEAVAADSAGSQPEVDTGGGGILDRSGPGESDLDVWVTFLGSDWDAVQGDWLTERATDAVIERLSKYHPQPETYFATLPAWATQTLPWRTRIKIEIALHRMIGDNDIHFSEWWLTKTQWQ